MDDKTKSLLKIINQFFEMQKKLDGKPETSSISRNIERVVEYFAEMGYFIHNPIGEAYNDTRTDCDASIVGQSVNNLVISEVIKPIVYYNDTDNRKHLLQRGVVIVQSE